MARPYKPHIPQNLGEILDQLGFMMVKSPTFIDKMGYFPRRNIDTVFHQLNEGLRLIRGTLGEERHFKLTEMSDRMRAHFEADPEDKTDDALKGRAIIHEMEELLTQKARKS
jgi:hypothetical protein